MPTPNDLTKQEQEYVYSTFGVDVYGDEIFIAFSESMDGMADLVKEKTGLEFDFDLSESKGAYIYKAPKGAAVFVPDERILGIIHHEALHLAFAILNRRGVKHGRKSEEAFTYLSQHIFENIVECLNGKTELLKCPHLTT